MLSRYPKNVQLKDGAEVAIRPLTQDDFEELLAFFEALPDEDVLFLRHDVRDPEVIRRWTDDLDLSRVLPLVAFDGEELVGNGTLHTTSHDWTRHVGHIRLVTARSHRNRGLGGLLTSELVDMASQRNLEKLQAYVIEDNLGAIKMFTRLGFRKEAVLKGMVKDRSWKSRDLAILTNDVADLDRILEEWIQFSTLPGYRAPGAGA
jgi:ribosomal protein S18 acetylase RimI-like enzyme